MVSVCFVCVFLCFSLKFSLPVCKFQKVVYNGHGSLLLFDFYYFACTSGCKPLMSAYPLFRELSKTAKLKGMNIDTISTLIGITHVLELCHLNWPK